MEQNSFPDLEIENDDTTQFRKFDRSQWVKIEKMYDDPLTNTVLEVMRKLGNDKLVFAENTNGLKVCGDEVYVRIRPTLIKHNIVDKNIPMTYKLEENKSKKKNKKAGNKLSKEEIIKNNIITNVNKNLEEIIKTFSSQRYSATYGFNSHYAELKLVTFMYAINYWMSKEINLEQCYELVLGIKKTLHNIKSLNNLSKVACDDLKHSCIKLVKFCNFKFAVMFAKFPRLCLTTIYDKVFPSMTIKAHQSQKELVEAVKNHPSSLIFYEAMINTGKTTVVMALCEHINTLRMGQKAVGQKPSMQLCFTCSVEPVRFQICRMAFNQKIPFGVAVIENGVLRIINHFGCKNDSERILIVADLDATIEILKRNQDPQTLKNTQLFIDEPTVQADQPNHPITKAIAKIMTLAPKQTTLCSATNPSAKEIPEIIFHFLEKHPDAEIISVRSKESLIGCEIINLNGSIITCHNNCKSCGELQIIVNNLKEKPFIDRLYTAPIVYRLREKMIEHGIKDLIDLETYFNNMDNLSQTNIQKAAIELLEKLVSLGDDKLVESVCLPMETTEKENNEKDDKGFAWDEPKKVESNEYDLDKIFTEQAYRYAGGCLIAVKDPIKFAYEKSRELLQNCESASKIIDRYKASHDKFKLSLARLTTIKNDEERTKKEQELRTEHNPVLQFPECLKINTKNHFTKFAQKDYIDPSLLVNSINLENIPLDFHVPDFVMLLLFAGVGIYSPSNKKLSHSYYEFVLNMAADGKLAFIIADDSISYGTNYPIAHVVPEDDLCDEHSIKTIFQLLGRAGRIGQSWVAYAHVGNRTSERIMNFIRGINMKEISEEAENINKAFNDVLEEINEKKKNRLTDIDYELPNAQEISIIKISEVRSPQPQPFVRRNYVPNRQPPQRVNQMVQNNDKSVPQDGWKTR